MTIRKNVKPSTRIAAPMKHGSRSTGMRTASAPTKQAGSSNRDYRKAALREDPAAFSDIGFGNTGLTGED